MSSTHNVYIAGAGLSPLPSKGDANKVTVALVSATTKALLDAGLTYDDVSNAIHEKTSSHASKALKAFGEHEVSIDVVESGHTLDSAFTLVSDKACQCVLVVGQEKSSAVAVVVVSEDFLWSRPYLKDSAAFVRKTESSQTGSEDQGLHNLCRAVWTLRGWSRKPSKDGRGNRQSWLSNSNQGFELSRADGKSAPEWKDVEHKQDGKFRLKYNPAHETKDISRHDYEGVRSEGYKEEATNDWIQFGSRGGDRASLAKL